MWSFLVGSKLGRIIAAIGAGIIAIFVVIGRAKQAGRDEVEHEYLRDTTDAMRRADEAGANSPRGRELRGWMHRGGDGEGNTNA